MARSPGKNSIASVRTVERGRDGAPFTAVLMGLDVGAPGDVDRFVGEVAERFKVHRMTCPPDTSALLVTIVGELTSSAFARRWQELAARDDVLRFFMGQMQVADVIHGTAAGKKLDATSLLAER